MPLLRFSWRPASHQLFALAILYYTDMDFETIPLFTSLTIILFSRPVSFLQTHPQDIPPSFLFNTEKHNSHDQWISLLHIHYSLTVIVLAELFLYSKINSVPYTFSTPSTQSMKLSITDGYFSSNLCRCTPSLQRSHLNPYNALVLSSTSLSMAQTSLLKVLSWGFVLCLYYHSEYPSSTFITQKLPASISKTPQTRQLNINE